MFWTWHKSRKCKHPQSDSSQISIELFIWHKKRNLWVSHLGQQSPWRIGRNGSASLQDHGPETQPANKMRRTLVDPRICGLRDSDDEKRTQTDRTHGVFVDVETLVVEVMATAWKLRKSVWSETRLDLFFGLRATSVQRRLLQTLVTQKTNAVVRFRRLWR